MTIRPRILPDVTIEAVHNLIIIIVTKKIYL
jgi:hypothetical protein